MLAFRVQVDSHPAVTGGASDLGVLTATISAVGKLGPTSRPHRDDGTVDVSFRLGGLTSRGSDARDEHLVWFEARELKPGSKVVIEIVETETPDPVQSGTQAEERALDEKAYFEHCKRAYLEMREQYEEREA
jgi:hypothetical protein